VTTGPTTIVTSDPLTTVVPISPATPTPDPSATANDSFVGQADNLFRAGKYEDAAKAYRHAAVDDPRNGALALRGATALSAAGRYDEAAGAAQQGLALLPTDQWLTATKDAASRFDSAKSADQAWEALKKAADDPKADPGVRFLSGVTAAGREDFARAAADLKAVTTAVPQDGVAKQLKDLVEAKAKSK
jgi:tetratricopeptide (TPR) repeat protein